MTRKLHQRAVAHKYAGAGLCLQPESPQRTTCEQPGNLDSTPAPVTPSFLAAISKPIGRKELCYELRISKHLLDMWISGERKDPIERVRDIMRVAAKHYPDLPLDIAQELVDEFGGLVVRKRTKD